MAASGYAPGTVGQIAPDGSIGVTQTPQAMGNQTDQDRKRVSDLADGFQSADQYARLAHRFMQNQKGISGSIYRIPGAQAIGETFDPSLEGQDNLSTQMATSLRAPGMRMTQMEFKKFGEVSPNVENYTHNNQSIANNAYQARNYMAAKSSYYSTYMKDHGSLNGADGGWNNYEAKTFGDGQSHAQGNIPTVTPAQAAQLPKGTHFMTSDGRQMVR